MQSPTNKNHALKLPTFGAIVGVSQPEVQWDGLILEEPPSRSRITSAPSKYAVWRVLELLILAKTTSCPHSTHIKESGPDGLQIFITSSYNDGNYMLKLKIRTSPFNLFNETFYNF